jgi:acid stress-induced BolA-like protein IbaG/YrbA
LIRVFKLRWEIRSSGQDAKIDLDDLFIPYFMITPVEVEAMIKKGIADAEVQVTDLTGGGDHYQAVVISEQFAGKTLVQQHQMVYRSVNAAMASEAIHALALKTFTPADWQAEKS